MHNNDLGQVGYRRVLEAFMDSCVRPYAAYRARILDFGSGPRPCLSCLLSQAGYRARPYDPLFFRDQSALRRGYNLIALHEVLEHCPSPARTLSMLGDLLAPGGAISLSTLFRPSNRDAFPSWWYAKDQSHISFFLESDLCRRAAELGFKRLFGDGTRYLVLSRD